MTAQSREAFMRFRCLRTRSAAVVLLGLCSMRVDALPVFDVAPVSVHLGSVVMGTTGPASFLAVLKLGLCVVVGSAIVTLVIHGGIVVRLLAWLPPLPFFRGIADAIMVGRGTIRDDDPELTCRLPGLEDRSPVRVVLAADPRGLVASKLAKTARAVPVWVFAASGTDRGAVSELQCAGVRVFLVPRLGGALWLPAVMEALVGEGITRLLVEGGPRLWRAFGQHGLVDELVIFRALGGGEPADELVLKAIVGRQVGVKDLVFTDRRRLGGDEMLVSRSGLPGVSVAGASGRPGR